jgi:hypothetical protein
VLLAIIMARPYLAPKMRAAADSEPFDVHIVSPMYLYQGRQGILLLDKRNENAWFIPKGDEINISFRDPRLLFASAREARSDRALILRR